jgi:hypothetical protein
VPELVALWTDEEAEATPWEPKYGLVTNGGIGVGGGGTTFLTVNDRLSSFGGGILNNNPTNKFG